MKKYLSSVAAILTVISLAGCSASSRVENGFVGTDIGGRPSTSGGFFGAALDGIKDAVSGEMAGGMAADMMTDVYVKDGGMCEPSFEGDFGEDIKPIVEPENRPEPQAGMLTGGEWNDNAHWSDWEALYKSHDDWSEYKKEWKCNADNRIAVKVTAGGVPVENAKVSCKNALASAMTDNKGMAYLFYTSMNGTTDSITVEYNGVSSTLEGVSGSANLECELDGVSAKSLNALDFMIMCDTTGSMGDELEYLKAELAHIVTKVADDNPNVDIKTSVNFYRDEGDDYVVRQFPFTSDISNSTKAIKEQTADGGGDFPEAVHTALDSAVNKHEWREDSTKIMFIVLDAPPHSDDAQVVSQVNKHIKEFAEKGIRIIPIASSGIDKSTEYLLRVMAFSTGGTYTFLTNDSGIGGDHIEATVGAYNVEKLSDMMIRIVNGYLG